MRKFMLLFIFLFLLTGCEGNLYIEESTETYEELSRAYDSYLKHDISNDEQFQLFINQVTLETATAGMMIEVRIYSELGALLEVKQFSGVIIHQDHQYHILTVYEPFNIEDQETFTISLHDYLGNLLSGELAHYDESKDLAILTIQRRLINYIPMSIKATEPLEGEPLLLIGYQRQIINAMTMGMMSSLELQTDHTYQATILSDDFGLGGAIIDSSFNLVGIQVSSHEHMTEFIKTDLLHTFIKDYLED